MTYTKPEVLLRGRAMDAVQMNTKGGEKLDSFEPTYSTGAYEADE